MITSSISDINILQWVSLSKVFKLLAVYFKEIAQTVFTPQPLRAVGVLFSPMAPGWVGGGKKFVWAVSQKP